MPPFYRDFASLPFLRLISRNTLWYAKEMPRFSIKDLVLPTTTGAVGMGAALLARDLANSTFQPTIMPLGLWLSGCSLAGAAVLYPFGRSGLGGGLGFFFAVLLLALAILSGV